MREPTRDPDLERFREALEWTVGYPFLGGNDVRVLKNGVEIFPEMLAAIAQAETTIDFLTFVYWKGEIAQRFAEILADKAREGVRVRALLDGYGARPMDPRLLTHMRDAGVDVRWFRPPSTWWKLWKADNRTHRKILVCDGRVGFTGGVGIAAEWEGDARDPSEWRDTHLRVEGPAVRSLEAAFLGNWAEAEGDVTADIGDMPPVRDAGDVEMQIVLGTASIGWSDIATLLRTMIATAQKRLRITTAYFAPDTEVLRLLRQATDRGVQVQVICPGPHHDERLSQLSGEAVYDDVLRAGVDLWNYQRTMLHAKVVTVDGVLSMVGSPNFNHRSMRKDDEACVVMLNRRITETLDAHFEQDLEAAEKIVLERWRKRPLRQRFRENVVRRLLAHEV